MTSEPRSELFEVAQHMPVRVVSVGGKGVDNSASRPTFKLESFVKFARPRLGRWSGSEFDFEA